jgi:hypothetical protein
LPPPADVVSSSSQNRFKIFLQVTLGDAFAVLLDIIVVTFVLEVPNDLPDATRMRRPVPVVKDDSNILANQVFRGCGVFHNVAYPIA